MVFVTVGNAIQGFRRLLDAVDDLAGQRVFDGDFVLVQHGNNPDFRAANCAQEAFLSGERFAEAIARADLVICHAGAGTLIHVFLAGKLPVVVPRRKKYGELVDDHQVDMVEALAAEGRIIPAFESTDLPEAIEMARHRGGESPARPPLRMLSLVREVIEEVRREGRW